eukprot:227084-Rhodomonas_salina.3
MPGSSLAYVSTGHAVCHRSGLYRTCRSKCVELLVAAYPRSVLRSAQRRRRTIPSSTVPRSFSKPSSVV